MVAVSQVTEEISALRARLDYNGFLFFTKLEILEPLAFLSLFGRNRLQEDGSVFYRVKAGEKLQPTDGGSLMPHTDDFNCEGLPPRYVALLCVQTSHDSGGDTLIADGYQWLTTLPFQDINLLKKVWRYKRGEQLIEQPFLSTNVYGAVVLRVSFGHLQFTHDEPMSRVMTNLRGWFVHSEQPIQHQPGSLLIWNNWRIIHGRNAYTDLNRELHRYYLD